ncbi:RluA family pseudouridine synthase [Rubinisphaera margarita]
MNADIRIVSWEDDFVVFNKPAPLPMHPCGRFNRNSMTGLLDRAFPELKLRPAHRLDANTTGLVVFTMHRDISQRLQRQFEKGTAKKRYVCRVLGHPEWEETRCEAAISARPNELGFRGVDAAGDAAVTEFRVLQRFENNETLIEAVPVTGRTNQIRVHLWHLGVPIAGDPVYKVNQHWGERQTLGPTDPPMMLHAQQLTFADPRSESLRTFESPWPDWTR